VADVLCFTGASRSECELNEMLADVAEHSVPGFGCSDCSCSSHLHYFRDDPASELMALLAGT
jgi:sugar fermentation stimulation protein A